MTMRVFSTIAILAGSVAARAQANLQNVHTDLARDDAPAPTAAPKHNHFGDITIGGTTITNASGGIVVGEDGSIIRVSVTTTVANDSDVPMTTDSPVVTDDAHTVVSGATTMITRGDTSTTLVHSQSESHTSTAAGSNSDKGNSATGIVNVDIMALVGGVAAAVAALL